MHTMSGSMLSSPLLQATEHLIGLPITPPTTESDPQSDQILYYATHVLSTEATALSHLSRLYATDPVARGGFVSAVEGIAESQRRGGKFVVIGVGKSGKIGDKLVATMNSLGVFSCFLNPVEALHGDLGILRPCDIVMLITYSGNTPELLTLLPHIPSHMPLIVLTSHTSCDTAKLTSSRNNIILLPAPIPELEEQTFGVPAPTTSTTVAIALGDALALAVAHTIHSDEPDGPRGVFKGNHPGGAIGLNIGKISMKMSDHAVPLLEIPLISEDYSRSESPSSGSDCSTSGDLSSPWPNQTRVLDCLVLAVRSPKGWVRTERGEVIPPRALQKSMDPNMNFRDRELGLLVPQAQWIKVPGDASIEETRRWLLASRADEPTLGAETDGLAGGVGPTVIGVVVDGKVIGVLELEELLAGGR